MRNIAVSIMGRTYGEIIEHVTRIMDRITEVEAEYKDSDLKAGILEFRADYYEKVTEKTELLEVLGKEESLSRIDKAIEKLSLECG